MDLGLQGPEKSAWAALGRIEQGWGRTVRSTIVTDGPGALMLSPPAKPPPKGDRFILADNIAHTAKPSRRAKTTHSISSVDYSLKITRKGSTEKVGVS